MILEYTGDKAIISVRDERVQPGSTVGSEGSGAAIETTEDVLVYLASRGDFKAIGAEKATRRKTKKDYNPED